MAGVCTADGGFLRQETGDLAPGSPSAVLVNGRRIKEEDTSRDEYEADGQSGRHASAELSRSPSPAIKEEPEEDFFQIRLCEVKEDVDERADIKDERGGPDDGDADLDSGEWISRCMECDEAFGRRDAYLCHLREHAARHGPALQPDPDARGGGSRRAEVLPAGRSYECLECGKTYVSSAFFLKHQRSHQAASQSAPPEPARLKERAFLCPECGRSYSRASALEAHRRGHEVQLFKLPRPRARRRAKQRPAREEEEEGGKKEGQRLSEDSDCDEYEADGQSGRHASAELSRSPSPAIKEEPEEDFFQIRLCEVKEDVDERADIKDERGGPDDGDADLDSGRLQVHGQRAQRAARKKGVMEGDPQQRRLRRSKIGKSEAEQPAGSGEEEEEEEEEELSGGRGAFRMRPREGKPVYVCSVCGKVYSYLESFRNHQKLHRSAGAPAPPCAYPCPDCGKVFSRPAALGSHRQAHRLAEDAPPDFHCAQCRKPFNSVQTWRSHLQLHRAKAHWCQACAKGFKDRAQLERHLLRHDLKRHKCDLCHKAFRVPAELRYHRNTHTGARPYRCELCQKTFSQLGNLITHRKKHLGVYRLHAGGRTPLGAARRCSGGRQVSEMKVLIVKAGQGGQEVEEEDEEEEDEEVQVLARLRQQRKRKAARRRREEQEAETETETSATEEGPASAVKLRCFECGALFAWESELHLHYMRHASGDL
ncbi:ZN878 protein, partial [Atractosteus spatula]|nr:ZN878 protein [Atractosteus spatula]